VSLQTRLEALVAAIGADIKALQSAAGTKNQYNTSVANQVISGADAYLAGASIAIPQGKVKVGTIYRVKFNVVKTNQGTAAPIITVRVGTAGAVADASRAALTFAAQTAVVDEGEFEIECAFRQAGATAIIQAVGSLRHRLTTTGLNAAGPFSSVLNTTPTPFDVTGANLKIGLSVNAPNPSSWTISLVTAALLNLAS
jgi:hypothetical protein